MLVYFGFGILVLSFLLALFTIGAAVYGARRQKAAWIESARRAILLTFPLLSLAAGALIYLLVTGHYEVKYVYSVTSNAMPLYLKITALWGGQAGSLVFWSWLLSAFVCAVSLRNWEGEREFLPWVLVVTAVTLAFFLSLSIFFENPFERWWLLPNGDAVGALFQPAGGVAAFPPDGRGLNPLLRHPGMILHPPMLYLGFVAFVIPYAFAIAALATGRSDDRWIRVTRRWTLTAWLFLSLGLVLGMRWAYDVLGWGGYWGWDPVENAALMPWLIGTPFLHTAIIQEKRGVFKHFNMALIILTYVMVIVGTFLTRSGVLSSVHAFAQSAIGPMFFGFIVLTVVISFALLIRRWPLLRDEIALDRLLSREALFLLAAVVFLSVFFIVAYGVFSPLVYEIVTNEKITFGPPWYERATAPLFGLLMLLMGVAPLSAWSYTNARTLGRALWKPTLPALLTPLALALLGIRNLIALIGFTLVVFVLAVSLYEYGRGVRARMQANGENPLQALGRLFARNRRRYGGYLIHIAMVVMAIGILGIELFQTETQRSLAIGEEIELGGYTLRYDSLAQFPYTDGRQVTRAELSVFKDGAFVARLAPRYDLYPDGQPMTIPGVYSTLADDLYVVLVNWENVSTAQTPFKVYHNPLVNWLWIGSLLFIGGMILTAWPPKENRYP
ncbi:MAG: heme lyase CcmF/NrfE family subunit [Anaerolineales bacterium]